MKRTDAYRSFVYWGGQIVSPLGKINKRAEEMRAAWAWAFDTGYYKKLPQDALKADDQVLKAYKKRDKK